MSPLFALITTDRCNENTNNDKPAKTVVTARTFARKAYCLNDRIKTKIQQWGNVLVLCNAMIYYPPDCILFSICSSCANVYEKKNKTSSEIYMRVFVSTTFCICFNFCVAIMEDYIGKDLIRFMCLIIILSIDITIHLVLSSLRLRRQMRNVVIVFGTQLLFYIDVSKVPMYGPPKYCYSETVFTLLANHVISFMQN